MTDMIATAADLSIANDADVIVAAPAPKKARVRKPAAKKVVAEKVATDKLDASKDKSVRAFRVRMMKITSAVIATGTLIITSLSLYHIALGVSIIIGKTAFGSDVVHVDATDYCFALTFDAMMASVELALLFSLTNAYTKNLTVYGPIFVIIASIMSGMLNAVAFAQHAHNPIQMFGAAMFGVVTTGAIFFGTKIAGSLYMAASRG